VWCGVAWRGWVTGERLVDGYFDSLKQKVEVPHRTPNARTHTSTADVKPSMAMRWSCHPTHLSV
jgi:hypothetical protein